MIVDAPGLRTDLALLELQGSQVVDHGDVVVVRTPDNPTYYWGNFLLLPEAGSADAAAWLERFEAEFPGARHRAVGFAHGDPGAADLSGWEALGFEPEVDVDLACDHVPEGPARVDGLDVRPVVTDEEWEQVAAVGASDAPPERHDDQLLFELRRAAAQRILVDSGRARWVGAFDGDRLVACLGVVRLGRLARYQNVVTHPDYRRRGIAGCLVRAAGEWALADPDVERLVIVAEDGGPAIGLYQRAGFTEVARRVQVCRPPA